MVPTWLHLLAIASLCLGGVCAAWLAVDVVRHPQKMAIMDVVWPVTGLFGSVLAVEAYRRWGRLATAEAAEAAQQHGNRARAPQRTPFAAMVAKGTAHCGSACMLADLVGEWLSLGVPSLLGLFGLGWLFDQAIFARWALDFVFAFAIGIVFQYFAIVPMRHLSFRRGIVAAVKADTLSLTAWQLGMYGFMAVAHFWIFGDLLGAELQVASAEFWFFMQAAMLCGFTTAYPVNWWLVRKGWKESM